MEEQIVLAEYALSYCRLGFHVIPIEWRKIAGREKRPLIEWLQYQERKATEAEVIDWWKRWPHANIGIVTGNKSGLLVVDIESGLGYAAFLEKYGEPPQDTLMQRTGKEGGIHVILGHPRDGFRYQNQTKVIKDCDTRGDGGYIVVAPSVHPSGKRYEWIVSPIEGNAEGKKGLDCVVVCPDHIKPFFNPVKEDGTRAKKAKQKKSQGGSEKSYEKKNPDGWVQDFLWGVDEGQRNEWAAKLTGWYLRAFNGDVDQVKEIMRALNERNRPPLDWKELEKTIDSIASRQGASEMGDTLGEEIDRLEVLKYPDGSKKYNVFLKGVEGYAQMAIKELGQFSLFKWRFSDLAGHIPKPVKQETWEKRVNKALGEAVEVIISVEETALGMVIGAIERAISSRDIASDFKQLKRSIIVSGMNGDQRIFLKISVLMGLVKFEGDRLTRKDVGELLRKIGFTNKFPVRTEDGGSFRAWSISYGEWQSRYGANPDA